jgi:hypothetical protein
MGVRYVEEILYWIGETIVYTEDDISNQIVG